MTSVVAEADGRDGANGIGRPPAAAAAPADTRVRTPIVASVLAVNNL
jgi:hypothetical protein